MPQVWISIGSNIERERHVQAALHDLRERFGPLRVSAVYETEAVGFDGDAFYNLVAGFDTALRPTELHQLLRTIEADHGRKRSGGKFAARTLDLDLLTYGDAVTHEGGKALPRDEILRYAFVLGPLADVAPAELHPELGESYQVLWQRFAGEGREGMRRLDGPAWMKDFD